MNDFRLHRVLEAIGTNQVWRKSIAGRWYWDQRPTTLPIDEMLNSGFARLQPLETDASNVRLTVLGESMLTYLKLKQDGRVS